MVRALVFILIGIGVIVYNHTSVDSMLVLRGTKLDFGYLIIALGVISGISAVIRKKKSQGQPEAAEEPEGE